MISFFILLPLLLLNNPPFVAALLLLALLNLNRSEVAPQVVDRAHQNLLLILIICLLQKPFILSNRVRKLADHSLLWLWLR